LFHLINRLSLLQNLKTYIQNRQNNGQTWFYSTGYKIGGKTVKTQFDFVRNGSKIVKVFEDGRIKLDENGEYTDLFEYSPDKDLFTAPFIIFDLVLGNKAIPTGLIENTGKKKYLYFNRDFVGIHSPPENLPDLWKIYDWVTSK